MYRRNRVAGATYFFTVNLRDRKSNLLIEHATTFRDIVRGVKLQLPFTLDAMVVMPNHWHAVWTLPQSDDAYASRLRLIKARLTRHLVKQGAAIAQDERGEYALWQKRFWEHTIRDDRDLEAHVNCVHINPVTHGYVERAADWEHSTIHAYVERGLLPIDWACEGSSGSFGEDD